MLRASRKLSSASVSLLTFAVTAVAFAAPPGIRQDPARAPHRAPRGQRAAGETVDDNNVGVGTLFPIPHDAKIEQYVTGVGVVGETTFKALRETDDTCRYDPSSVYCNTLGTHIWQPPGGNSNIWLADDIAIAAAAGCELDRYVIRVTGNADGLGTDGFTVWAALYPTCPGAGGATAIPGTECEESFDDNGTKEVTCIAAPGTTLPKQNLYLGIRFDRLHCGIVVGAPALKGFSADSFDFPGFACVARLAGYVPESEFDSYGPHASYYAEIYVRGECTPGFPGYKSSNHAGLSYTPGGGMHFADDISLAVPECNMVAMEVAVKGYGVTNIDLRTALDDADPLNGGVIPDTKFLVASVTSPYVVVGMKEFDPPIPLLSAELWVGYHTTTAVIGPIMTGRRPALGMNADRIAVHDGTEWHVGRLVGRPYAATDVTIYCAGRPPVGACCDMVFTADNQCVGGPNDGSPCSGFLDCPEGTCIGDSVCRDDLPEMNCPFTRWIEGETCEPGPFDPPCGFSACCTFNNECLDVTQWQCFEQPPIDRPRLREFQRGKFCCDQDQECDWIPCRALDADCRFPRDEPGCDDLDCCERICDLDAFCCLVAWDEYCVRPTFEICGDRPPNDECSGAGREGATLLQIPSRVFVPTQGTRPPSSDPGFCCHAQEPGAYAIGTVWYKFAAPLSETTGGSSSVLLSTCVEQPTDEQDSLIQVFEVADPDLGLCDNRSVCSVEAQDCLDGSLCVFDEEAACENLIPIACDDDSGCLHTGEPSNAQVCASGLVPGQVYYVMIGVKEPANRVTYRLEVSSPCDALPPLPNDACGKGKLLEGGAGSLLVVPFDLSGGDTYSPATFDCLNPPDVLPNMHNDVWYNWVAPCTGQAMIQTCDRTLPPAQQPNTTMVVYEACDCPADSARRIAYSDSFSGCGLSSFVWIDVTEGQCYKIRLGGDLGGTPAGNLTFDVTCECAGPVTFLDPLSDMIDARRPHPPDDADTHKGIDTLLVEGAINLTNRACWSVCETASGRASTRVDEVIDNDDGTFTLQLNQPIAPLAVTTVTYTDEDGTSYTGTFTFHPGNVNGDGEASAADVQALIHVLNDVGTVPWGLFSTDCDHSGTTTPADLLCVIDLLNGGDAYAPGYNGTPRPTNPGICP